MDLFDVELDITQDSVSEIVLINGGQMTVLKGIFDLASIRALLERDAAEQVHYREYELWQTEAGAFALFDGYIVHSGNLSLVQETLRHLYRGSGFSLEEVSINDDMVRVLDRLSGGIIVNARVRSCRIEHCLGYGWAITEFDTWGVGTIRIEYLFNDRRTAAAAEHDGIRGHMERTYGVNIPDDGLSEDGSFVVGMTSWYP